MVVYVLTLYKGSPGTSPRGYLGIHGISDNPDNGRGMRDTFIANNGCTGEENPPPSVGSLTHVKTEYTCDIDPVTWITFVSVQQVFRLLSTTVSNRASTGRRSHSSPTRRRGGRQWITDICLARGMGVLQSILRRSC